MNYIKNFLRNRLEEQHLNVAARLFQQRRFTLSNFPYADAAALWNGAASKRGRYLLHEKA
jgi:hypothetical protein